MRRISVSLSLLILAPVLLVLKLSVLVSFSDEQLAQFKNDPEKYMRVRKGILPTKKLNFQRTLTGCVRY